MNNELKAHLLRTVSSLKFFPLLKLKKRNLQEERREDEGRRGERKMGGGLEMAETSHSVAKNGKHTCAAIMRRSPQRTGDIRIVM